MKPVGFAVVGLGMGKHHVGCFGKLTDARLVGVCDIRKERRESVAAENGCRSWSSVKEMLKDPEVEVVNICTPSGTHAELTIEAARSGRHVLCEKPLDVKVEKIDEMIRACAEAGVRLGGIFQRRTSPVYQRARRAVQEGALGRIVLADASVRWYRKQGYYEGDGGWRGTWELDGGGSLMNQGVHSVDILQWIAGPIKAVTSRTAVLGHDIQTEDVTVTALEFQSGALGTISTTTAAFPGLYEDLNIHGVKGTIRIEDGVLKTWEMEDARTEHGRETPQFGGAVQGSVSSDPMAVGTDGHVILIQDMAHAVRENRQPMVSGEEGRQAVEIITAIYRSAREGRSVEI